MKNEFLKTVKADAKQSESMESGIVLKNEKYLNNRKNIGKKILFLLIACITLCGTVHAQSVLTHNFWTGVRVDGKAAKPKQIKEVLSINKAALKQYNTGRTFEMAGGVVTGVGLGLVAADMISNFEDFNLGTLSAVGGAMFAAGLGVTIIGIVNTGKSVRTYNSGLSSYTAQPTQLYFGFTPSGGVGFTMRF